MKKIVLTIFAAIILITISCEVAKSKKSPQEYNNVLPDKRAVAATADVQFPKSDIYANTTLDGAPTAQADEPSPSKTPITQYDTAVLDDQVRKEAAMLKKDPKTHRRFLRQDPVGTIIYRELGMHVIKPPDGELIFLPDEI